MTSGTRLLALITLIGLSMWLGFLLGARSDNDNHQIPPVSANESATEVAQGSTTTAASALVSTTRGQTAATQTPSERAKNLVRRIDLLASQTDDRVIYEQRRALLQDLQTELNAADAESFLDTIRYYNLAIPRDGTGLILESSYYQRAGLLREAIEPLLTAAEFPESNEQLQDIQNLQANIFGRLFEEHAALEDWSQLKDYFESLLLRVPNNDRARLFLVMAQARNGETERALAMLEITGNEAGVSQQEINELRETLVLATKEPIRFRAEGDALVANATLNSAPIELLVDTGATKTALSTSVLQSLGANPLNQTAQVLTAGGQITAQLYEVPELVVEQTVFRNSVVLALDNPPASWDGLLGMDLLREMDVDLSDQLDTRQ